MGCASSGTTQPRGEELPGTGASRRLHYTGGSGGGAGRVAAGHGGVGGLASGLPAPLQPLRHAGHPRGAGAGALELQGRGAAHLALHHFQAAGARAARSERGGGVEEPGPGRLAAAEGSAGLLA